MRHATRLSAHGRVGVVALILAILILLAGGMVRAEGVQTGTESGAATWQPPVDHGASSGSRPEELSIPPEPDPVPPSGRTLVVSPVGPYRSPAAALAEAQPGDTIEIRGGTYLGRVEVKVPVRLVGVDWPVLDGGGKGTVLMIDAPRVEVTGLVIRGTGDNLATEDAAIRVNAPGADIHHNRVEEALFGIYLRQAAYSKVIGNNVSGFSSSLALRGDAIRTWYSPKTRIEENRVQGGRDLIVWFSNQTTLLRNEVLGGRYGIHFMWSHDGHIEENQIYNNSVGLFIMYSKRLVVRRNAFLDNRGPSGYGMGVKDSEMLEVDHNWIARNRVGVYLDNSPLSRGAWNRVEANVVAGNDIGLLLIPSTHDNIFVRNDFIDNNVQLHLTTGGKLGMNTWAEGRTGNYWSDYAGYDGDRDGLGDMPYRSVSLFENLMTEHSSFRWFLHSPAAAAIDLAARAFPAVAPEPKMEDPSPSLKPFLADGYEPNLIRERAADGRGNMAVISLLMLAVAGLISGLLLLARRGHWQRFAP